MKEYPRKFLPNLPRFEPESMDHTATKEFKTCPRRYFYRMVLGRTTPDGKWESVFAWGSALHKYLEVLYETGDEGNAAMQCLKLFRAPTNDKFAFQSKERLFETMGALLKMYKQEKANNIIQVISVEQPFKIKFPDGITIGGRFDQIIKWNGRLWIRDWKTTSKIKQYFAQGLEPNDQAIRYIYAASVLSFGMDEHGYPLKVVDGVLFPAITNMKTVGPTIENVPSTRSLTQVKEWVEDQKHIHKMMQICREEDTWPKHEVACTFCPFRGVCNQPSQPAMENMLKTHHLLQPWKHEEVDQKEVQEQ